MAPRPPSSPELRFDALVARLDLSEIQHNKDPKALLSFTDTGHGTSIIKGDALYHGAKNFHRLEPDRRIRGDLIEIKDDIAVSNWASLWRGYHLARNDVLRVSLLRMATGCVPDVRKRYADLSEAMRLVADKGVRAHTKSNPADRLYVDWEDLIQAIRSPSDNFNRAELVSDSKTLPLKVVAGMEQFPRKKLYLVDDEIMDLWDAL